MKIVSESLADQVYAWLKAEILKGSIKAGEKISEEALAVKLGVSRTPIREALKRLSEYGIVFLSPRSHAIVIQISDEEAEKIAEFRICLEDFAIETVREDLFNEKFPTLEKIAAECLDANERGDRGKCFEKDSLFHAELVSCSGSQPLLDAYTRLSARIQLLRLNQDLHGEDLGFFLKQHSTILGHIKDGRKDDAKKLIRFHTLHRE